MAHTAGDIQDIGLPVLAATREDLLQDDEIARVENGLLHGSAAELRSTAVDALGLMRYELTTAADWGTGPHDKSNWLFRKSVMVGGWPCRLPKGRGSIGESSEEGNQKLWSILNAGVSTFVSLTEPNEIHGKPYCYSTFRHKAEQFHADIHGSRRSLKAQNKDLRFICCPMPDGGACSDQALATLLEQLLFEVRNGRILYIHCYGGHGRTGIVGCALWCLMWSVNAPNAVQAFNDLHGTRKVHGIGGPGQFPHSTDQFEQVDRVVAGMGPFAPLWHNSDWKAPFLEFLYARNFWCSR